VELNPLAEFTGCGLFDFQRDRAILLGQAPFEFRVSQCGVDESVRGSLAPDYLTLLDEFDW
jgi:hypothetical protein